jgi:hypothetical protein
MTRFEIVEGMPWHCGQMVRILRQEHQKAVAMIGFNSHRELRAHFDESSFRRAWFIDGKLAAIGGVTGPELAAEGFVWLAFSQAATRYPVAIIKEARRQIELLSHTKRVLVCSLVEGDEAAERLAIFLGFVPMLEGEYVESASSRFGRLEVRRLLREKAPIRYGLGHIKLLHLEVA